MMTESAQGQDARGGRGAVRALPRAGHRAPGQAAADAAPELGKLAVFSGVCEFPVRVKCASLRLAHAEGRARTARAEHEFRTAVETEEIDEGSRTSRAGRRGHRHPLRRAHPAAGGHHASIITQALGGSYTAVTDRATWCASTARTRTPSARSCAAGPSAEELDEQAARRAGLGPAKTCYDPEIPVNIVELGLVYSCDGHAARRRRQQGRGRASR